MLVNDWFVVKASTTAWPRAKNNGRRWDNTEALATQSCLLLSQNADAIPLGTLMCTLYLKAEKTLSVIYLTPSYTILHHLTPSYTILHHLTPSYTILHLHRPKMPKLAPQLHQTSTVWEELPALPMKAPLWGRGFRSSRLTIWLVAKAWQWHAMMTQIYGLKLGCQWTRKISQNHAKSAFVCFHW